jgi:hypothetical protein
MLLTRRCSGSVEGGIDAAKDPGQLLSAEMKHLLTAAWLLAQQRWPLTKARGCCGDAVKGADMSCSST